MKTYAVKVKEVSYDIILVDAETEEEAQDIAEQYNEEVGCYFDYIADYTFDVLGEANEEEKKLWRKVEI